LIIRTLSRDSILIEPPSIKGLPGVREAGYCSIGPAPPSLLERGIDSDRASLRLGLRRSAWLFSDQPRQRLITTLFTVPGLVSFLALVFFLLYQQKAVLLDHRAIVLCSFRRLAQFVRLPGKKRWAASIFLAHLASERFPTDHSSVQ
jgi:hypothetical protein